MEENEIKFEDLPKETQEELSNGLEEEGADQVCPIQD